MDGRSVSLPVDSACTSAEVCQAVAKKIKLKDTYGFSLYIGLYDKVRLISKGTAKNLVSQKLLSNELALHLHHVFFPPCKFVSVPVVGQLNGFQ